MGKGMRGRPPASAEFTWSKGLVVIPTYNERENLGELVPQILAQDPRLEVLVVDDGSPDGTGESASMAAEMPRAPHAAAGKAGPGSAYRAGFQRSSATTISCSRWTPISPTIRRAFRTSSSTSRADLVIGSRILHGVTVVNWPMGRLVLSFAANRYTRLHHRPAAQ